MPQEATYAIRHLRRAQLDEDRYAAAVARVGTPYAYPDYLDRVTGGQWNCLVLDDYRAVLPLPYNRKLFGLLQVYQPPLCQQLGVGGSDNRELVQILLSSIPSRYRRVHLPLRAGQQPKTDYFATRTNLVLDLQRPYAEIASGYGKSLRKRLRRATEEGHYSPGGDPTALVDLYRQQIGGRLAWPSARYRLVSELIEAELATGRGFIATVQAPDGTISATGFFLRRGGRVVNLFGASSERGRATYAMHLLLDRVIAAHAQGAFGVFDFEGSDIPGVAAFFRSFGAEAETYRVYQRDTLPAWAKLGLRGLGRK